MFEFEDEKAFITKYMQLILLNLAYLDETESSKPFKVADTKVFIVGVTA